jgi:hypothetical protein
MTSKPNLPQASVAICTLFYHREALYNRIEERQELYLSIQI